MVLYKIQIHSLSLGCKGKGTSEVIPGLN